MAETKTIRFDFDNDNRPIREDKISGKLFEPQYTQAMMQIESYLRELELEKTEEDQKEQKGKTYTEHIGEDIDYNNNIFVFEGGRGTGKTSCMLSVAGMLEENKVFTNGSYPQITNDNFTTIDLIDPSYFDKSHNLLSLFLAKLYKSFTQQTEKVNAHISTSDKQDFLRIYKDAHSQLHRLYREQDSASFSDEDLMEYVEDVSASVKLKRTIQDLVDLYLACLRRDDTILILRIDDVDMDFKHASEMIESMRKYFVQPNMLVFVSCSLEQLKKIKTHDFLKEITKKEDDPQATAWCQELADKYICKVFPQSHCIKMPDPETYHDYELLVAGKFTTDAGNELCESEKDSIDKDKDLNFRKFVSVKQALLELILKKTRYLFYNTSYYESYIVPRNLRELRQLMKLLITMPDSDADNESHPHNKTLFKEYFFNAWVQTNLGDEDIKIVRQLQSVHNMTLFNMTLKGILKNRFGEEGLSEKPKFLPITTADILYDISTIESRLVEDKDRKLIFFIKSFYSMLMYDTYSEILSELSPNDKSRPYNRELKGEDGKTNSPIIRKDKWREYFDYEKLAGGLFLKLNQKNLEIVIDAGELSRLVKESIDLCHSESLTDEDISKICFVELIVLSIYYVRVNDEDAAINLYEQWSTLPSKELKSEIVISVGALLFNITRYDQSIIRYNEEFHTALIESDKYTNFKKRVLEGESNKTDYGFIHRVSLRNFEVLQDVVADFRNENITSRADIFINELEYLSQYSFPLYEYTKSSKEEYNKINLTFFGKILSEIKSFRNNSKSEVDKLFSDTSDQRTDSNDVTEGTDNIIPEPAAGQDSESSDQ